MEQAVILFPNINFFIMRTLRISILSFLFISFSSLAFSQAKSEKIKVAGECGMCKNKIEKAAKTAGASYAVWNVDNKELTVKYNGTSTNNAKIQNAIAAAGYDTESAKATDEAYGKLHECCKYERTSSSASNAKCCEEAKCAECQKDGKCSEGMDCCKDGKCTHKSETAHAAKSGGAACCKKTNL
jgi:hypothetical protein